MLHADGLLFHSPSHTYYALVSNPDPPFKEVRGWREGGFEGYYVHASWATVTVAVLALFLGHSLGKEFWLGDTE